METRSKLLPAQLLYVILGALIVFTITFVYTLITYYFDFIVISIGVFVLTIILLNTLANKMIDVFKIDNIKKFRITTAVAGILLFAVYYYAKSLALYCLFLNELDTNIFVTGIHWEVQKRLLIMYLEIPMSITKSYSSSGGLELPQFINYIIMLIVFGAFVFPKGQFSNKKMYHNGRQYHSKQYVVVDNSSVSTDKSLLGQLDLRSPDLRAVDYNVINGLDSKQLIEFNKSIISKRARIFLVSIFSNVEPGKNLVDVSVVKINDKSKKAPVATFPSHIDNVIETGVDYTSIIENLPTDEFFAKEDESQSNQAPTEFEVY